MEKFTFFMVLICFSLTFISFASASCINTADSYASEVLLNKPGIDFNLNSLNNAQNVILSGDKYILQSSYSSSLALILEKQSSSLSVRLQMPVTSQEENLPYLKFSMTSNKVLNLSENNYNNWKISCTNDNPQSECEFTKGKTDILASLVSGKYEITIETYEELSSCQGCGGRCISTKCINQPLLEDIQSILKESDLVSSIDEIIGTYRVIGSGNSLINDLAPEKDSTIDWNAAMSQELTHLKREGIVLITDADISEIAGLATQGKAGQNSRIVYGNKENTASWLYYYETNFPDLTKLENCNEFPSSLIPTGMVIYSGQQISNYYLVPMVMTAGFIGLLVILIITARLIDKNKRKRRLKPITSLQAN
jgi:hypothetical protein